MSEGPEDAPRREVPTWLLPGLVVVLGGAALAGLLWWLAIPQPGPTSPMDWTPPVAARVGPGETERYVGTASCRECHPGECAAFARSGHARTLRPAASDPI